MSPATPFLPRLRPALLALTALGALTPAARAQEFVPEVVTTKPAIDPGPNVFVSQQQWIGAGTIAVFDQETLKLKELLPTGSMSLMLPSADGQKAYAVSSFMKRITYGENEMVLTSYDVPSGALGPEVVLPPKAAMALGYSTLLKLTGDGKFVLVQNATPAASVTVVDLAAGKVVQEIPTPGCWGIYPAPGGAKFSTVCGDGSLASFALTPDGTGAEKTATPGVFDPEKDPIFIEDERIGDMLYFVTYGGTLIGVKDSGAAVEKVSEVALTAGVEGGWAPGGYGVLAGNAAQGLLFLSMHPGAYDGSHKLASKEVWTIEAASGKVLARSEAEGIGSMSATPGEKAVLFATSEEGHLFKYTMGADYKLTKAGETGLAGFAMHVAVVE